jgi:hypothetical protein
MGEVPRPRGDLTPARRLDSSLVHVGSPWLGG